MIRKQTIILLVVFAALVGLMLYLRQSPLPSPAAATPSVTAQPVLLPGWAPESIESMIFQQGQGTVRTLAKNVQGAWTIDPGGYAVEAGKVEQIRAQMVDLRAIAALGAGVDPNATGLNQPALTLTLRNAQGEQKTMVVGGITPIETGYYMQVDGGAPVVVNKIAVEAMLDQVRLEQLANITPTPAGMPVVTPTP